MPPNNRLPPSDFSPEVTEDLATAFNEVWAMLYAQVPPEGEEAMRLSLSLSRTHTHRPRCRRDNRSQRAAAQSAREYDPRRSLGPMNDKPLSVEGTSIVVTMPGTSYLATYLKTADEPGLMQSSAMSVEKEAPAQTLQRV